MKMRTAFILLGIGLIISLIEPVMYYFADKDLPQMPQYTSYEEAIFESLSIMIQQEAEKNDCRNYILPIMQVQGSTTSLPNLKEDLNLALASYSKWRLSVNEQQRIEMRNRFDETLEKWGSMLSGADFQRLLTDQRTVALRTDYSAEAVLSPLSVRRGNDLQLLLTVNLERTMSKLFDVRVTFTNPETVLNWQREIDERTDELNRLSIRNLRGIYSAIIIIGISIILVLTLSVTSYISKRKHERELSELRYQIEKRDELIDNGHFVAALELAERYLLYYPNDVDIKAFKERILDYTNNDPKKAQVAYVEFLKIKARLSKPLEGNYLSESEKREINNLLPYHPQLAESYPQLISFEEEDKKRQELKTKLIKIRELINQTRLNQADLELKTLELNYGKFQELSELRAEINDRIEQSREKLQKLLEQVLDINLIETKQILHELLSEHQDFIEAENILSSIENKKLQNGFQLVDAEDKSIIKVLNRNVLILGREEEGIEIDIAINDKHVSRPHLKISIEAERVLIEDLDSTGGTYINGEAVSKHTLRNDELLTLAKVVDIDFSIFKKDDNTIGGILINLPEKSYLIVTDIITFSIRKGKLSMIEGNYTIIYQEGVPLIISDDELSILSLNQEIAIEKRVYKVKEY